MLIAALCGWILVLLILKLWARGKLRDIEGVQGTSKKDFNRPEGNVIGAFGDHKESPGERARPHKR
jgi:hypothetical protein